MSKVTRGPELPMKHAREQIDAEALSPRVREMVGELHDLRDAIESGLTLNEAARVRTAPIKFKPPVLGPRDVRAVRESLGLNQAMFADFLGVGRSTLRRWEAGQVVPTSVARRFLSEVRDDPSYWRKRPCR